MEPQTPAPQEPQTTPVEQPMAMPEQQPVPTASTPVESAPVAPVEVVNPGHGLGIAGLVLAFLSPLIGFVLSIIALNKSKKAGMKNGVALAGVIISSIGIVVGLIIAGFVVFAGVQLAQKCADLGPGTHYEDGVTYTCD
jgi:hypothetical protein